MINKFGKSAEAVLRQIDVRKISLARSRKEDGRVIAGMITDKPIWLRTVCSEIGSSSSSGNYKIVLFATNWIALAGLEATLRTYSEVVTSL